jgi:tetratricopeptide (TPR) repeat protein
MLASSGFVASAYAQIDGQLFATEEAGYGRLILSFPGLDSLPEYKMRLENGVLSLEFADQVSVLLPDVGLTMPDYLSAARVDPDGRGLRIGLRSAFKFNRIEAGEKLFIDLLPTSWQGMPPTLPQDVIDELAERARLAAIRAEQERKAAGVAELDPRASVRIGRNPTFLRLQFDWTVPTSANYAQLEDEGMLAFEWPVEIDLNELLADLPPEIVAVEPEVTLDGTMIALKLAPKVKPRFYQNTPRQQILDIDIAGEGRPSFAAASLVPLGAEAASNAELPPDAAPFVDKLTPQLATQTVEPFINVLGSTVRVVFPFEQDTPAAVFRRGDSVWMIFDTVAGIVPPARSKDFDAIASTFEVVAAGDTQVVRIDLSQDRLATLGSEGMAWVLSLGDVMLTPTEPITMSRRRDVEGDFELVADVARPARAHDFRDPVVGDMLKVVTAYPPARGVTRTLDYVDFSALRSVHGLVIKPKTDDVDLAIETTLAVISAPEGLTVSELDGQRVTGTGLIDSMRGSYVDLARLEQRDFAEFGKQQNQLLVQAASAEGQQRDQSRLDLAHLLIANQFGLEAIGVIDVLAGDLKDDKLKRKVLMARAMANVVAGRSRDALNVLNEAALGKEVDALIWRAIGRADISDFKGAKTDALAALPIIGSYPRWVQNRFTFAAIRAGVETGDARMAEQLLDGMDFNSLDAEGASLYLLMNGRIAELRGRADEAIDIYGQVIAADVRPTRAEAIFRTLHLLDKAGKLNLQKASQTLGAEALLWRGNPLEADMLNMLADFFFRDGDYRSGFETVQQAVSTYPESPQVNTLRDKAQEVFADLFLNGAADALPPVNALGLYYDFRALTPPGARGDEMIRNLARRLVRVDLLNQAAVLLEYQLENRLRGVARTQVAADLAVIYLADRKPTDALRVLNATRLPEIPDTLARQRRVLEARAMIDGGRDQLALSMLRDMEGADVAQLRIDALWKAKRYSQAGEMIESLYADPGHVTSSQPARMGLIKAAVGYVLADDRFGLARLRSKFGEAMVTTPEWPMFDLVTGNISVTSVEFKTVASQVSGLEGINAFLAAYRETYGSGGALAPMAASESGAVGAKAG